MIGHTAEHVVLRRKAHLNIVCLSGELAREQRQLARSLPVAWTSVVLDVHREGDDDPGVVPVVLKLPPSVVDEGELEALWAGRPILVIGKLDVDVDYTAETAVAYHSVIAHRIEFMPCEGGEFGALTPRIRVR
ncbi:MAG TPA: hypothetical protein VF715_12420 [Thermoleophilaceae bacterium]